MICTYYYVFIYYYGTRKVFNGNHYTIESKPGLWVLDNIFLCKTLLLTGKLIDKNPTSNRVKFWSRSHTQYNITYNIHSDCKETISFSHFFFFQSHTRVNYFRKFLYELLLNQNNSNIDYSLTTIKSMFVFDRSVCTRIEIIIILFILNKWMHINM